MVSQSVLWCHEIHSVGLPSPDSHNRFSNLCLADFDINSSELASWEQFSKGIFKYGFTKTLLQGKKIVVPGVKTFESFKRQCPFCQQSHLTLQQN
jgi:hypothetical protein